MKKLGVVLVVAAGTLLLLLVVAGAIFYVRVYRPIGSPLMAMGAGRTLEERRLQNHKEFLPPPLGELTEVQVANFMTVEEAVEKEIATGAAILAKHQADLERASEANALSVRTALAVFGDIKPFYLNAKVAQIGAMNRAGFSKDEFEWVRKRLYGAAGIPFSQLDVSEVLDGVNDAVVVVRRFKPPEHSPEHNEGLALPLGSKLHGWGALAFFGL
jgi:hypothetical protein